MLKKNTGPIFYAETINSDRYDINIDRILRTGQRRGTTIRMVSAGFSNCPYHCQFPDGFGRGVS
jgi:hypothetical protein